MRAKDVKRVGVVGFGLMGSGIAEVVSRVGVEVVVLEPTEELLAHGRERVDASTGRAVERGKLDRQERDALVERIRGTTEVAALADVQLVIEAATEDRDAKLAIFRELDRVVGADAILASNTSSIPIATLASATTRPDKVVGLHFFNPPPAMDLVEVTPSLLTSADTVSFARAFGERLGKTTVLAKDEAGFIVNRLLIPYLCAAIRLLDAGFATREDISKVCVIFYDVHGGVGRGGFQRVLPGNTSQIAVNGNKDNSVSTNRHRRRRSLRQALTATR